ncbi:MAG: hypothetical protein RLZ98_614 [Pseudomonadota bacterium]|jgi:GMP synthase (glutamine-hydrolysing)
MLPFLILQLRPEADAADNEFEAFLDKGGLSVDDVERVRLDCEPLDSGLDLSRYAGVIVGGGPGCVSDPPEEKSPLERRIEETIGALMPEIVAHDVPYLGCCYGIGILAHHLGARVGKDRYGEGVGAVECTLTDEGRRDPLLAGLPETFKAFVGHKEAVEELPQDTVHLLASEPCPYQMIRHRNNIYATQFHPEADSRVFELRINVYRNKGYFPPADAERLIDMCHAEDVRFPEAILRNFVLRYRKG